MNADEFRHSPVGTLVPTVEGAVAFIPAPLPRTMDLGAELVTLLESASRQVGILVGIGETLPNPRLLIQPFVRREAVLSSRIEGTQASISDVYEFEAAGTSRTRDVAEVVNYVRALGRGEELLAELPICTRLVREVHEVLLAGARGEDTRPGQLRDRQVWIGPEGTPIGAARFVPPPHTELDRLLADWEAFVNSEDPMPPLVRCALMHYQFETIHPFRDGNGRIGRLLTTLYLEAAGVLPIPLLYLSAYFESNHQRYYDSLLEASWAGDFEQWVRFFLAGVEAQAADAITRSRALRDLQQHYRSTLEAHSESANAFQVVDSLFENPFTTRQRVAARQGITVAGARLLLSRLEALGIVQKVPRTRPQRFVADGIVSAVST